MDSTKEEDLTEEEANQIVDNVINLFLKSRSQYVFCSSVVSYFGVLVDLTLDASAQQIKSKDDVRNFIILCNFLDKEILKIKNKLMSLFGEDLELFESLFDKSKGMH
jgi:hypothetical protein